jgi:hypothetical protein
VGHRRRCHLVQCRLLHGDLSRLDAVNPDVVLRGRHPRRCHPLDLLQGHYLPVDLGDVIYLAIAALDFFILIVVISGGSTTTTARRAEVAAIYLYNQAFDSSRWGYASAIGVVLLILTLFLSLGIMRVTRRETYEF